MSVKRYTMDENTLMGGMDIFEDDEGDYVLHSDYTALESKYKTACTQNKTLLEQRNSIRARHNTLLEAVAWERECYELHDENAIFYVNTWWEFEVYSSLKAARAEVDRLLEDK